MPINLVAVSYTHLDVYKRQVLSRDIASQGIYPAVDPLDSTSRILSPEVVGQEHYEIKPLKEFLLSLEVTLKSRNQKRFAKTTWTTQEERCV